MDQNHGNINCKTLTVDGFEAHSQQYNLTVTGVGGGWTTATGGAVGVVYSVSDGVGGTIWRMAFNIVGAWAAKPSSNFFSLSVANVTFKDITGGDSDQAVTITDRLLGSRAAEEFINAFATKNSSAIASVFAVSMDYNNIYQLSGDVELNAKPSFVA